MSTIHINAPKDSFADTVLMPGDPLRAKFIAENFLHNAKQICDVRGMLGFTGTHNRRPVSIMGHGMGIPSVSIYATELINHFGVKNLIRVGSCGAVRDDVNLMDIVIGMGASTDSKVNRIRFNDHDFAALADFELTRAAATAANKLKQPVKVGNLFSADLFYSPEAGIMEVLKKYGVLGVEMEAAGLYGAAAEFGAKALTICTVSDHIIRGEALSSQQRQTSFKDMINLALSTVDELS